MHKIAVFHITSDAYHDTTRANIQECPSDYLQKVTFLRGVVGDF